MLLAKFKDLSVVFLVKACKIIAEHDPNLPLAKFNCSKLEFFLITFAMSSTASLIKLMLFKI